MVEESVRPYAYSVSLDCTAKGYIQPSVKVQADELAEYHKEMVITLHEKAVVLLDRLVKSLRDSGYKVATDIVEGCKNGKD